MGGSVRLKFYVIGLIAIAVISLVFSILAFLGKDLILSSTYTNATEEEREKMNKKALRNQSAIFFLLLAITTLSNALGFLVNPLFRYIHIAMLIATIVYYVVSNKKIKNNK